MSAASLVQHPGFFVLIWGSGTNASQNLRSLSLQSFPHTEGPENNIVIRGSKLWFLRHTGRTATGHCQGALPRARRAPGIRRLPEAEAARVEGFFFQQRNTSDVPQTFESRSQPLPVPEAGEGGEPGDGSGAGGWPSAGSPGCRTRGCEARVLVPWRYN